LTYPSGFSDYGDIVSAQAGASVAFRANNNSNNLDVDMDGGAWQTVFFGTSWVPLYNNNAGNGETVMQRIVDFFGGCAEDPISGLAATNDSPTYLGDTTHLTATVETGTGVSFAWDFGDGNFGSGATPFHVYPDLGSFTAIVTATNSVNSETTTTTVTIVDVPITGLVATNDSPTELGSLTTLTATIATGTNATYAWDFGDGTMGSGAVDTHTYPAVGSYTATVTATNGTNTASATTVVAITDVPIEGLTAENDGPTLLGGTTSFTATITAGSNVVYTWNFGDGITMTGQVVGHVYAATGTYTATVTATNSQGFVTMETVAVVYTTEPLVYHIFLPLTTRQ